MSAEPIPHRRSLRLPRAAVVLAVVLAAPGCGNERNTVNSLVARPSPQTREVENRTAGLTVELPRNLDVRGAEPPGLFRASFGKSVVAAFAYRRREPLPADDQQLSMALDRLERAAKERSRSYRVVDSRTTEVAGARAVELLGDQTISQGRLRTRSLHVYKGSAEYVIELLAPRTEFARIDRSIFPTIRRTLEVTGEVRTKRR